MNKSFKWALTRDAGAIFTSDNRSQWDHLLSDHIFMQMYPSARVVRVAHLH